MGKLFLPLAGGLLLALASVAEVAAASPTRPGNLAYRDAAAGVEVRLNTAGRFAVITPTGADPGEVPEQAPCAATEAAS